MSDFNLKLLPFEQLIPHEMTIKKRTNMLEETLLKTGYLGNPIQTINVNGKFIILDGHHRFNALKSLKLKYAPVQVIDQKYLRLKHWYHIIKNGKWNPPATNCKEGFYLGKLYSGNSIIDIRGNNDQIPTQLWEIFNSYSAEDFERSTMCNGRFPWVCYNGVNLEMIVKLTNEGFLLPPGITRFIIMYRILNLNVPLKILESGDQAYWEHLCKLASRGRVYDEPTISVEHHLDVSATN